MRSRLLIVTAAAACAVAPAVPSGRSATLNAAITSLQASAKQGGPEHLAALAVGGYTCSLHIRYRDGRTQALGTKRIVVFGVSWTWRVPANAAPGPAEAVLACGTAGGARASFNVARRLVPARLVVAKSGLTQVAHAADDGTDVAYGVVLVNTSPTSDALGVHVEIDLLDGAAHLVGSEAREIAAIPAGGTYYLGGELTTRDRTAVASVRPIVRIGSSTPKSVRAPIVSGMRVTQHGFDEGAYVDGQIVNRTHATLSSLATISMVLFDGSGRVIGGGVTFPAAPLAAGASSAFEISTPVAAAAIASVLVSVEPRYTS